MPQLTSARYGKDNIRVYKVHRDQATSVQTVVEMTVCVLLEGEIDTSYTQADNSVIVATDTMKNTVYILSKQHPVTPPELFASIVSTHFITTYKHIHAAHVKVVTHRWTRMTVDGKPHPHSFFRDGAETRNVEAVAREGQGISIRSAIAGLLVLKSTGSAFHDFVRDEYTSLPDVYDRILSTEVDCGWTWNTFDGLDHVKSTVPKFDEAWNNARTITIKTFATDSSASVQNTMYKMCDQILAAVPAVAAVDYSLPNKHYFEIDLSWHKGLKNTGKDAEVYAPQSNPNGLIQCTVTRQGSSSKL
ncbi:uricase [Lasallia pustulata]|uniref:Uricase n=1 Tax=Lasallia pustulata TaxID=136370 RepID=A0A1W5DBR4_9LECA|nr:uricase [Lasallia pustulata]